MIKGVPGSTANDQSRTNSDTLEEPKHYGLHRHFTGGTSVVMFGGGMKRGFIHGATAAVDRRQESRKHPGSPCHHFHRHGHQPEDDV